MVERFKSKYNTLSSMDAFGLQGAFVFSKVPVVISFFGLVAPMTALPRGNDQHREQAGEMDS
jgi:hypothetical protein